MAVRRERMSRRVEHGRGTRSVIGFVGLRERGEATPRYRRSSAPLRSQSLEQRAGTDVGQE